MGIITPGIKELIEKNALALATVGPDGRPHNIAIAYCLVAGDNVVVTNVHIAETIANLENNPQVSLAVWHKDWEKVCVGFELKGEASHHVSGPWFEMVKNSPDNEGYDVKGAIVIAVKEIKKLLS